MSRGLREGVELFLAVQARVEGRIAARTMPRSGHIINLTTAASPAVTMTALRALGGRRRATTAPS
jgi:hypothetical protein